MANTYPSTNVGISSLIKSQIPFFVRNDHENFVKFLEAYYEWLELADGQTNGIANSKQYNVITRIKNINSSYDIDRTSSDFADNLYETFMKLIPQNVKVDKALLLKNIKDFYRSTGSEKSAELLLNIIFGGNKKIDFYYPKKDILRASDGKWFIERSLRISDIRIDGVPNNDPTVINFFANNIVTGSRSNANAIVEQVETFFYFAAGLPIKELKLSNKKGDFENGESVFTKFRENGLERTISANVFGGIISSVNIVQSGNGYSFGTEIPIVSENGVGGRILVTRVTSGNISSIALATKGSGFQVGNKILFSGGGGTGAAASVLTVSANNAVHPNSYNIIISLIGSEANTPIGNLVFSNLNSSNANVTLANALTTFTYANCGPTESIILTNTGDNYTSIPVIDIDSNTRIRSLGILGSMQINDGGTGYEVGDTITFKNVIGGYGVGALANVKSVNATGSITEVQFIQMDGHVIGGAGYTQAKLPLAIVNSANVDAIGANIAVTSILGDGEQIIASTTTIGKILEATVQTGGFYYDSNTTLDLTNLGDGTAKINVTVVEGVYTYPGRWLNDDGHLSSYNFLENRDYYQNFSYVVKIDESIKAYRKALLELVHPTGVRLFGEYTFDNTNAASNILVFRADSDTTIFKKSTYESTLGNVVINTANHGLSSGNTVYLEFVSGDTINISNGPFIVVTANTDYFNITHPNTVSSSGNVYTGIVR